ncbi:unnamed protein product [Linum tenue]|uniref:Glycosyltransferase n=1 Tax=Linum tenue TaxID=586396 RepID=A0AAV0JG65_9ROSI|nr:unnamed protein product [Linum tenue]
MAPELETTSKLHFVLTPLMAQGHLIPMIDIAKLLAQHGVVVTLITTPVNAKRVRSSLARAMEPPGIDIRVEEVEAPCEEVGLSKRCENLDQLPSLGLAIAFMNKSDLLFGRVVEELFEGLRPRPNCIISDMSFPYTSLLAKKHGIPRIAFNGFSSLALLCLRNVAANIGFLDGLDSDSEPFLVPGMPDRIELTKSQLPLAMVGGAVDWAWYGERIAAAEAMSYGTIINSFQELEPEYFALVKEALGGKAWCVGPVSSCNKDRLDRSQRGSPVVVDESVYSEWLDSQQPDSVIYVCFGSICNIVTSQLIELALGLEASNHPFMWVVREGEASEDLLKWMEESGFEQRSKGRGFVIRGWAPQVAILSHPAIGGFLTHCGWNSTLEGISAGLPMATWPLFADQFCNERLIVDVLNVGVKIGAKTTVAWGQEEKAGVTVRKEDVKKAIEELMGKGIEMEKRKNRVKQLSEMSKVALEEGGSSHTNIKLLIQDISRHREANTLKS